tara:strand:- start:2943 stop:3320 length:378 start_codon:yes stop_codon:yes gene_type:complete
MPSVLNVDTIADKAGTGPVALTKQEAAKAWINLNGNGTIAARDSLNMSGLTDEGTGEYTVAFSSSFANVNFCTTEAHEYSIDASANSTFLSFYTYTASSIRVELHYAATNYDHEIVSMASTGDLA